MPAFEIVYRIFVCKLQWKPVKTCCCRASHHNPAISIFLLVMLFKALCSGNNGLLPCQQEPCHCHMLFSLHTFSPWLCHCNQEPCHTCFFLLYAFSPRQEGMLEKEIWLLQHGNEERRRNLPSFLLLQLVKELADCWVKGI